MVISFCLLQEEDDADSFEKELDRLEKGRQVRNRPALSPQGDKEAVEEYKALGRLKGQDVWTVIPSYPEAMRSCSQAPAALPVTQVSVERLFSAMRLLLSDLRSRLKQDAVEASW